MTDRYPIRYDIPAPKVFRRVTARPGPKPAVDAIAETMREMRAGGSFVVPMSDFPGATLRQLHKSVASKASRVIGPGRFATRSLDASVRVWRLAA